ncbi:MAG: hypothetical protein QM724_02730 [Flavobacteriales bacterium]
MRISFVIALSALMFGCNEQPIEDGLSEQRYRDTTITWTERVGDLTIDHYHEYDSIGQLFETAHVTAFDTIRSTMTSNVPVDGRSFLFGPYRIWTPSLSEDTFEIMSASVRKGAYLCFLDTSLLNDAFMIERRTEGYGAYYNSGFLVVPSKHDTLPLWSLVDRSLPKPVIWDWNGLVPMTLEQYEEQKQGTKELSARLVSPTGLDPLVRVRE